MNVYSLIITHLLILGKLFIYYFYAWAPVAVAI